MGRSLGEANSSVGVGHHLIITMVESMSGWSRVTSVGISGYFVRPAECQHAVDEERKITKRYQWRYRVSVKG